MSKRVIFMRRYIFILIVLCMHCIARGQTGYYWFDRQAGEERQQTTAINGQLSIDVSALMSGVHTIHYQMADSENRLLPTVSALFIKPYSTTKVSSNADTYCCWFDEDYEHAVKGKLSDGGIVLDTESLANGVHTVHVYVEGEIQSPTLSSTYIKFLASESKEVESLRCVCYIDGEQAEEQMLPSTGGVVNWSVDVSSLPLGVHTQRVAVYDQDNVVVSERSSLFVHYPQTEKYLTKYDYWLNDEDMMKTVELEGRPMTYNLLTMLPVEPRPIRPDCFQFSVVDGTPTVYAKNDIHIRFHDASGEQTDVSGQFVDSNISQEVEAEELLSGVSQTIAKPADNEIRWFKVEAVRGDSLTFKTSHASTLQLFSPSGEEIYAASGAESLKWDGCHAEENGIFYLAVHDVTAQQGTTISIDYVHIDKYAVLRQDVTIVGNGGCSTITFEGNGFHDLYAVELIDKQGNTIQHVEIGHESDATTTVTFDFTDAALGKYDVNFRFTEEDKLFAGLVTVEEAKDIELATTVTYPSTFLRGTSTTYTIKITNKGNMTAYDVPIYTYISSPIDLPISKVVLKGLGSKTLINSKYRTEISDYEDFFKQEEEEKGFLAYLLTNRDISEDTGDSCVIHNGYYWQDLPPYSTVVVTLTIYSVGDVYAWFTPPSIWISKQNNNNNQSRAMGSMRKSANSTDWMDCLTEREKCFQKYKIHEAAAASSGTGPIFSRRKAGSAAICELKPYKDPDCPPDPPRGGKTNAVNSYDPNEIFGYVAESGSCAVNDERVDIAYTIQFENDTTFATASACDIYVTDTLDAQKFDLSTFKPTNVKIGEKTAELTGEKNFVTTIDMRPEINAIAQVEGSYDQTRGIAEWHITSLDPMTMEPTKYITDGVLPVNTDGHGIGELSFDISLKSDLPHGTEVKNRAAIAFDYNDAIMTPWWTNTIDKVQPNSRVKQVDVLNETTALVNIVVSDEGSGAWRYDVYAQYGVGAPWGKVAENVPIDSMASVEIYDGINHGFYVIATDSAGNVEQKNAIREFTLNLSDVIAGDVNGDGVVNLSDADGIVKHFVGRKLEGFIEENADADGDGSVNLSDARKVVGIFVGKDNNNARKSKTIKQK